MDPPGAQSGECTGRKGAHRMSLAPHFMHWHRLGGKVPCYYPVTLQSLLIQANVGSARNKIFIHEVQNRLCHQNVYKR